MPSRGAGSHSESEHGIDGDGLRGRVHPRRYLCAAHAGHVHRGPRRTDRGGRPDGRTVPRGLARGRNRGCAGAVRHPRTDREPHAPRHARGSGGGRVRTQPLHLRGRDDGPGHGPATCARSRTCSGRRSWARSRPRTSTTRRCSRASPSSSIRARGLPRWGRCPDASPGSRSSMTIPTWRRRSHSPAAPGRRD